MDKRDKQIKKLEGTILGQIIMLESLVELLYKHDIISKEEYSTSVSIKIKNLEKELKNKADSKDPFKNSMFYGEHGDA